MTIDSLQSHLILTTEDAKLWAQILPATANVFGSLEYARIAQAHTGNAARLFVVKSSDSIFAYPFLLRPVASLPFVPSEHQAAWDIVTPEFTGPLLFGSSQPTIMAEATSLFADYCHHSNIIAEFAHLHPFACRDELLDPTHVSTNREVIYVDLQFSEEELWHNSFSQACRKNINRSQREGVRVYEAQTVADISEFYRIYAGTMDRNGALSNYYFPLEYFVAFFKSMPEHARFLLAEYQHQVVAGTLYLHDDNDVYSYLGGADQAYQAIRPTNAVVYDAIRWAKRAGKKRLILGGGYRPDDGIFRFKSSFSSLRAQFKVCKKVHDLAQYNQLCDAWAAFYAAPTPVDSYFPAYRAAPAAPDLTQEESRVRSQ